MAGGRVCEGVATVACDACESPASHRLIDAREMMFGLRERFTYQECGNCGHVQLLDVPEDMGRYYPADYYSLNPPLAVPSHAPWPLTRRGSDLVLRLPPPVVEVLGRHGPLSYLRSLSGVGVSTRSRLCDVGCGGGRLLVKLWSLGFRELVGYDPFVEADREVAPSVWVRKVTVEAIEGSFDSILLNHSFEHMPAPRAVLDRLRDCLRPGGAIIVRVPLAGSFAWSHYGSDWVGLDPPRHLFVPSERSMRLLAERAGLRVERVFYDSHALQFWGSEQYLRAIPLRSERSWAESPERSPFSPADIARWSRQSRRLNAAERGDAAGFVLRAAAA